jgi:hypothetical protein
MLDSDLMFSKKLLKPSFDDDEKNESDPSSKKKKN